MRIRVWLLITINTSYFWIENLETLLARIYTFILNHSKFLVNINLALDLAFLLKVLSSVKWLLILIYVDIWNSLFRNRICRYMTLFITSWSTPVNITYILSHARDISRCYEHIQPYHWAHKSEQDTSEPLLMWPRCGHELLGWLMSMCWFFIVERDQLCWGSGESKTHSKAMASHQCDFYKYHIVWLAKIFINKKLFAKNNLLQKKTTKNLSGFFLKSVVFLQKSFLFFHF